MINATIRDLFGMNAQDWMSAALCAETDAETFYPERGQSARAAKKICASCPVKVQCLRYAITHDERFGVWGGLSERERRHFHGVSPVGLVWVRRR